MGELFERYVAVDWSAAGRPTVGSDSIWVAVTESAAPTSGVRLSNPPTRRVAERELQRVADGSVRTLVAIDATLGYPMGTARRFGLDVDVEPWVAMWAHVATHLVDDGANSNNRFDIAAALNLRCDGTGPFWGCPRGTAIAGLDSRKPASFPLPEFRRAEQRLRAAGWRPASAWQLYGAGSVGGQTLTVLPVAHRLVSAGNSQVWPFTTGLTAPRLTGGAVVLAECWPTTFDVDPGAHPVRDAAQVDTVVRRLRDADRTGELASWFAPDVDDGERFAAETEEGWVLTPRP